MHVKTNNDTIDKKLHFSHLFEYVSAYEFSEEMLNQLESDLISGLAKAKRETIPVMVDQDGEHFFICNPSGSFDLCIRWKSYRIVNDNCAKCGKEHKMGEVNCETVLLRG
jgi:hypothetical protein